MHVKQGHMKTGRGPDNHPVTVREPVVRELLLDKDQRFAPVDDLVTGG